MPLYIVRLPSVAHRTQAYPHGGRKSITSSMKRKDSKDSSSNSQSFDSPITSSPLSTAQGTPLSSPQKSSHQLLDGDNEALISERAGHIEHHSDSDGDDRHVQFNQKELKPKLDIVDIPEDESYDEYQDEAKKKIKG